VLYFAVAYAVLADPDEVRPKRYFVMRARRESGSRTVTGTTGRVIRAIARSVGDGEVSRLELMARPPSAGIW